MEDKTRILNAIEQMISKSDKKVFKKEDLFNLSEKELLEKINRGFTNLFKFQGNAV